MFSSLLLICTLDFSDCRSTIDMNLYETEDQCYNSMANGFKFFEKQGLVVVGYHCHKWNSPIFDEQS
jgi:hypothetical protein